MTLNARDH